MALRLTISVSLCVLLNADVPSRQRLGPLSLIAQLFLFQLLDHLLSAAAQFVPLVLTFGASAYGYYIIVVVVRVQTVT
jgi:hypothetical protein